LSAILNSLLVPVEKGYIKERFAFSQGQEWWVSHYPLQRPQSV
jgi:hypothetical protein